MTLEQMKLFKGTRLDAALDRMDADAENWPYSVVFDSPWGFDYMVGASSISEARGTAKATIRKNPESEAFSIWKGGYRIEQCDLLPPSDDDRALQALGWPNASEAASYMTVQ